MSYTTAQIVITLKAARDVKGLSQRELSKLAGVPQSHISKIESGAVDLRVSSLVELARVLDLELILVPRKSVSAVQSIVRSTENAARTSGQVSNSVNNELKRLQLNIAGITQAFPFNTDLAQLQRQIRDLQHLRVSKEHIDTLRDANKALRVLKDSTNVEAIRQTLSHIQNLRNAIAHSSVNIPPVDKVRPAYSLDEDDHG